MSVIERARHVKDWPNAGFAVRGHRSPAQGRSLPCRYVRSPEVTLGSAATFDHRTYRSTPAPPTRSTTGASSALCVRLLGKTPALTQLIEGGE